MKYAIVRTQGHQYKISEGEDFLVPKIVDEFKYEVLLVVDGEEIQVGTPLIAKHKLVLKVTDPLVKGVKIDVFKYKAKARYRKRIGSRPQYSRVMVEKIA